MLRAGALRMLPGALPPKRRQSSARTVVARRAGTVWPLNGRSRGVLHHGYSSGQSASLSAALLSVTRYKRMQQRVCAPGAMQPSAWGLVPRRRLKTDMHMRKKMNV